MDEFGEVDIFWSKNVNVSTAEMVDGFSLHLRFCLAHFEATVLACPEVSAEPLSV